MTHTESAPDSFESMGHSLNRSLPKTAQDQFNRTNIELHNGPDGLPWKTGCQPRSFKVPWDSGALADSRITHFSALQALEGTA
jgi:hypothetical protein